MRSGGRSVYSRGLLTEPGYGISHVVGCRGRGDAPNQKSRVLGSGSGVRSLLPSRCTAIASLGRSLRRVKDRAMRPQGGLLATPLRPAGGGGVLRCLLDGFSRFTFSPPAACLCPQPRC